LIVGVEVVLAMTIYLIIGLVVIYCLLPRFYRQRDRQRLEELDKTPRINNEVLITINPIEESKE